MSSIPKIQHYLQGQWLEGGGDGEVLFNAITGDPVGRHSIEGLDFKEMLDYGRKTGGPALRNMTFYERGLMLKGLAFHLKENKEKFYKLSWATGATRTDSWIDIEGGIGNLFAYASLRRQFGSERHYVDGDMVSLSKGGAALTIKSVVEKPIKFISTGEKMEAIDVFHPDRMAQRILGMGDVISLVEKAQDAFDQDEAERLQKKLRKNTFGLDDFLSQLEQIKKMGNIKDLMGMIPGMGKALKDVDLDNESFKPIEAIIKSMTQQEKSSPEIINGSRKKRIADGSGTSVQEVNNLLRQFNDMRKMMKTVNKMGGMKQRMANAMMRR